MKLMKLTLEEATRLALLPLNCVRVEYPNKTGQVLGGDSDLKPPREIRPAFFGCFDWHSAVHAHWSLVALLRQFPSLPCKMEIIEVLQDHITAENIKTETAFFNDPNNTSFERTYGWAWLLKLAGELHTWDHELAPVLEANLKPLSNLLTQRFIEYLPRLRYPVRSGEHPNTAFGLSLAYDYAKTMQEEGLVKSIEEHSRRFYMAASDCPLNWEPGGYDFLSPCLEEANLMGRILGRDEYRQWLEKFLPGLESESFTLEPAVVSDRKDGKLVHSDGLNFSRAWCLYGIAGRLPGYDHLIKIANEHIAASLPNLTGDSYEGSHWLGTFAIYALQKSTEL